MSTFFDQQEINVPCPNCQHKFPEKVGRLKDSPQLNCPACGNLFQINAEQLRNDLNTLQEGVDKIRAAFKRGT